MMNFISLTCSYSLTKKGGSAIDVLECSIQPGEYYGTALNYAALNRAR